MSQALARSPRLAPGQPLGLGMGVSLGLHLLLAAGLLCWPLGPAGRGDPPEVAQTVKLVELPPAPKPLPPPPPPAPPPEVKPPPPRPLPAAPPRVRNRPPSTSRPSPVFSAAQEKPVASDGPSVAAAGEAIGASGLPAAPAGGGQLPLGTEEAQPAGLDWGPYWREVWRRIEGKKDYPAAARRHGLEGKVRVDFVISPEGGLLAATVGKSSGCEELDQAALRAVRKAAPYPLPPAAPNNGQVKMEVSIAFQLL